MPRIRIELTENNIPIILKSTDPFDELALVLSNIMHEIDINALSFSFEEGKEIMESFIKASKDAKKAMKKYGVK